MNYRNVLPGKRRTQLFSALQPYLDQLFDFLFQVCGDEALSVDLLQSILRKAMHRFPKEKYDRYLGLWIFRLSVEAISSRYQGFVNEQEDQAKIPYAMLLLEEKLALLLSDRMKFSESDVAAIMQVPVGRVGRLLAYAREKVGAARLGADWRIKLTESPSSDLVNLTARAEWNKSFILGKSKAPEASPAGEAYARQIAAAVEDVESLPKRRFVEIESSVLKSRLLPLLKGPRLVRWEDLSWQAKLGVEGLALGLVGLLALVVFPWVVDRIDTEALRERRYTQIFRWDQSDEIVGYAISADRLLASAEEEIPADNQEVSMLGKGDEFSEVEFPSGDSYESGAAPVAPSRQSSAVFRLIVQSSSPKDLMTQVRSVFESKNVKERESSGKLMPGGVYFDGLTSVGEYPEILESIQKLGKTKTYANPGHRRNPNERARVIVWIQQI